ncbi:MAG TPA: phenylacetate--CoA ligase [Actinomycetes bacterium]|jgi:phenylacetate-CoA ligase|nr:phenylacetate--CoA ligase [Actinomycetes bacterium]
MWNQRAEAMPLDERASLQQQRLGELLARLGEQRRFYRRHLHDAGVDPAAGITLDDLPALPFTTKADLWEHYPWGLLTVPREQVVRVHGSSGTGGRPTLVAYSRADLAIWAEVCARALGCAGAGPGTVIHNAYGYGLFTGGLGMHAGAELMGCTLVPVSGGQTARQVTLIRDLRPEVLCCTPSYAARLGEALAEAGVAREEVSLRVGIFGAEPWSEAMRGQLEAILPLKALDIYGLSEVIGPGVSCECIEAGAAVPEPIHEVSCTLHVNEDHFLVEVVDPATGKPLPPRTRGELVFTTLTKQAMPLLRYRTGDIAALDPGPCVCGRTLVRMSKVLGRADDMLVIRGVNVYPSEVEAVLLAEKAVGPQYLLVVDHTETMPSLVVVCELAEGAAGADRRDQTRASIAVALERRLALRPEVHVLPTGTLPRIEIGKAQRVVERTRDHDPLQGLRR